MAKFAGFCLQGGHISRKESKTHDDRIEHNDKMSLDVETFYIVLSTIFTTYPKDCLLVQ